MLVDTYVRLTSKLLSHKQHVYDTAQKRAITLKDALKTANAKNPDGFYFTVRQNFQFVQNELLRADGGCGADFFKLTLCRAGRLGF